ncbi:MAG: DUF1549 and DUF1553 domain-containing protein [Planctomycetota bacterium]|nr:DUF1549 and DUF1553 domain-containing protein [Planctomycetota bacterium]
MRLLLTFSCAAVFLSASAQAGAADEAPRIIDVRVSLSEIRLTGPGTRWSILVGGTRSDGLETDLTREATFSVAEEPASKDVDPVLAVSTSGVVRGLRDGQGSVIVAAAGKTIRVSVTVEGSQFARELHFENDIIPIFTRFGCNTSGCHGKAEGQNGFKLSIFGFDPDADRSSLTQEGRGRRTVLAAPEQSLLLRKSSGGVPHGGGIRIRKNSGEYRMLRDWIAAGAPAGAADAPKVVSLRVEPGERRMAMAAGQQLQAIAILSDGTERDVTHHAKFQSNNEGLATVDEYGLVVTGETPGDAAIMASYMGGVGVFRAVIPQSDSGTAFPQRPVFNFIDGLVDARLRKLNIHPSDLCSDSVYLRRVYLDIIGTLPTAEETRRFLKSDSPKKRAELVDSLLKRPEYADFMALKWSDLLRVDRLALGHKPAYSYYRWIHDSFAANRPMDEFARGVITADGLLSNSPAGNLYKVVKKPGDVASTFSQVLLGVRIECAQCHHHPFDRWAQSDYFGMQAFFTQVSFKTVGTDQLLLATNKSATKHPRSGEVVQAHALLQAAPETTPEGDRRVLFADWLTDPKNEWFARNIANRTWADFTGRGLVEPVDDARLTNPPTNPELLDALADHFVKSGFDLHELIRTIAASRTYQLSTEPNELNQRDEQNYSRALLKKLNAEVLFDMICQVTGVGEKFDGVPNGPRAVQLWDSQVKHYFLTLFGRPVRATACECERADAASVSQVLHMLNSPQIHAKLEDDSGHLARLVESQPDLGKLADELYLAFYSRLPNGEERETIVAFLQKSPDRRKAVEDVAWSLMNTVEFLFNH